MPEGDRDRADEVVVEMQPVEGKPGMFTATFYKAWGQSLRVVLHAGRSEPTVIKEATKDVT